VRVLFRHAAQAGLERCRAAVDRILTGGRTDPLTQRTLALSLALLALASCSDSEAKERLRSNARATWESALEVAEETRIQALEALEARMRELQARLEQMTGQTRAAAEKLLADYEVERAALRQQLQEFRTQGGQAVERLKAETGAEFDRLSDRLNERLDELLGRGAAETEVR
jgi:DNA anti-recombination protein RmuC